MTAGWKGFEAWVRCDACGISSPPSQVTVHEDHGDVATCVDRERCLRAMQQRPLSDNAWPGKPPDPTAPGSNDPPEPAAAPASDPHPWEPAPSEEPRNGVVVLAAFKNGEEGP